MPVATTPPASGRRSSLVVRDGRQSISVLATGVLPARPCGTAESNRHDCKFPGSPDASELQESRESAVASKTGDPPRSGATLNRVTPKPSVLDASVTERIGDFLRARGLRRMASRIQVLAVLEPVNGHLPVAEIHKRMRECLPSGTHAPDVATIYRTVTTLVDQGVLHALTARRRCHDLRAGHGAAPSRGMYQLRHDHRGAGPAAEFGARARDGGQFLRAVGRAPG